MFCGGYQSHHLGLEASPPPTRLPVGRPLNQSGPTLTLILRKDNIHHPTPGMIFFPDKYPQTVAFCSWFQVVRTDFLQQQHSYIFQMVVRICGFCWFRRGSIYPLQGPRVQIQIRTNNPRHQPSGYLRPADCKKGTPLQTQGNLQKPSVQGKPET